MARATVDPTTIETALHAATPSRLNAKTLGIVRADFIAALTVAAISLPQSMAYALVAGVDPRFGLYSAIIFTTVAAIFGSSRHLINGPTGAVSLVVFSALAFISPEARLDAFEAMFLLAVLIGAVQILIAVARLGDLTRYISESVVTGFIIGAAALTIVGQIGNALGLKSVGTGHQNVLYRLYLTLTQPASVSFQAVVISGGSIALAIVSRSLVRRFKLPKLDMLFVVVAVSLAAYLAGWSRAAPGSKALVSLIDAVPQSLPAPHIAEVKAEWLGRLLPSAFSIGVLGILEALAIAKAIAHKSGQKLDYNRQILAEGLGNLVGGFFRCIPGAGSLSRTALNYQSGAVTRFSGVYTALIVAAAVLLFAPLTGYIPKAALAGLLIVAAARLIDLPRLRYILAASRYDALLLFATAFVALVIDIELAILIGVVVSLALYVPRASKLKANELIVSPERVVRNRLASDPPAKELLIYDIEGELFFGAAPDLDSCLEAAAERAQSSGARYLVLRLKRVRNPDAVALEVLDHFLRKAPRRDLVVLLAGVRDDLFAALKRIGIIGFHPEDLIFREEDEDFSATLRAVRHALALAATRAHRPDAAAARVAAEDQIYYLI